MYPKKLRIKRGQRVRWHFDTLDNEVHNAVLPYGAATDILNNTFQIVCDPDGDGGPGPDNPADFGAPPYCAIPEQLEVDLDEREPFVRGNGVFSGSGDLENSGIRGSQNLTGRDPFDEAPWDVRFMKRGRVRYFCTVHGPIMTGSVVVR
jgi:plastocyanin